MTVYLPAHFLKLVGKLLLGKLSLFPLVLFRIGLQLQLGVTIKRKWWFAAA